jgi:hypothetical protein
MSDDRHPASYAFLSYSNYLTSRTDMLKKMALDHVRWEHDIARSGKAECAFDAWIDVDGREHIAVITCDYLDLHCTMMNRVVRDMEGLGPFAKFIADRILLQQRAAFEQTPPLHEHESVDAVEEMGS